MPRVIGGPRHLSVLIRGAAAARAVFALLDEIGSAVSVFEGVAGDWQIDAYPASPVLTPQLSARLALAAAADGGQLVQISELPLVDRDWLSENQLAFPPLRIGRFFVYGSHFRGRVPAGAIGIALDAATAFGTGEHPSTQGCLVALEILARRRITRPLDVGAGTGILSIAAAKLLRRRVRASDIDPGSVKVARRNIVHNRVGGLVRVDHADGYRIRGRRRHRHDLILSNILARPLALLAADLARSLAPGGYAVLSGLLRRQEPIVLAPHRALGLALERRIVIDGWSTLVLRGVKRPGAVPDGVVAARRLALRPLPRFDRPPGSPGSPSAGSRYRPARDRRAPSTRHRRAAGGAIRQSPSRRW
ncbi:MAG: 50S ribosomal protein L11 methyltransferase [Stellaceae bacterium]